MAGTPRPRVLFSAVPRKRPLAKFPRKPGRPGRINGPTCWSVAPKVLRLHGRRWSQLLGVGPWTRGWEAVLGRPTHSSGSIRADRLRMARIKAGNRLTTYRAARSALSALETHLLPPSIDSGGIASIRGNRSPLATSSLPPPLDPLGLRFPGLRRRVSAGV